MPRKAATATAETTEAQRGRPRPDEVVQRDEKVFSVLTDEPQTTQELVAASEIPRNLVYLSLYRLRVAGRAKRAADEAGALTRTWVKA